MPLPPVTLRIAFESSPLASGSWVLGQSELGVDTRLGYWDAVAWDDVSATGMSGSVRRGRQNELQRIEAGTADLRLLNTSGDFWPDYAGSVYFPNVLPAKRIQIRVGAPGDEVEVYTGYIERWVPHYLSLGGKGPVTDVQASDFYRFLANMLLNDAAGYPEELSGARVNRVLDDLGIPSTARDIDAGQTTVIATGALANVNALEHLRMVQDTEGGILFQHPAGNIVFYDRHARLRSPIWSPYGASREAVAMFGVGADLSAGSGATDRAGTVPAGFTYIDKGNPVAGDGVLDGFTIWAATDLTDAKVLVFYETAPNVFSVRSTYSTSCSVTGGAPIVETFGYPPNCKAGDYLGIWLGTDPLGTLEADAAGGAGYWVLAGDQSACYGATFAFVAGGALSIEAVGVVHPIRDIELEMSDALVFNDVRITRDGGTEQVASDGMSQQNYGYRTYQKSGLLMTTDAVASSAANYRLGQHKGAHLRVLSQTFQWGAYWPVAYDLSTKIWVKLTDAAIDGAYFIEGIEHRFSPMQWETKWWLSRADAADYWTLGLSALGIETRLGY